MGSLDFGSWLSPQPDQTQIPMMRPGVPLASQSVPMATPPPGAQPNPQHVGAWNAFLTRLAGDKNMQMAMLNMGAQLLQRRPRGQSQAGAISAGLAGGVNLYDKLQTGDVAEKRKDTQLELQGRQVAAAERNAQTAADAERANAEYRAASLPTAEERAARTNLYKAQANRQNAMAENQGLSQSIGADEHLARLMAEAKVVNNPKLKMSDAILESIHELKTMGKKGNSLADFKAKALLAKNTSQALTKAGSPEWQALQDEYDALVAEKAAEIEAEKRTSAPPEPTAPTNRNPQPISIPGMPGAEPPNYVQPTGAPTLPQTRSPDFQAADAKWQEEIAKNPMVDRVALAAHIQQYVKGWTPPAASGQVIR